MYVLSVCTSKGQFRISITSHTFSWIHAHIPASMHVYGCVGPSAYTAMAAILCMHVYGSVLELRVCWGNWCASV